MSALQWCESAPHARLGLKGPRAAQWLMDQGVELPGSANTWLYSHENPHDSEPLLVARLGTGEFFLEGGVAGVRVRALETLLASQTTGVYPFLREDAAFSLSGEGVHDVLAQVCSLDFARTAPLSRVVIMTMMIGVAVLVVAEEAEGEIRYRIWCDPSFGAYLSSTMGTVVMENGGKFTGVSA